MLLGDIQLGNIWYTIQMKLIILGENTCWGDILQLYCWQLCQLVTDLCMLKGLHRQGYFSNAVFAMWIQIHVLNSRCSVLTEKKMHLMCFACSSNAPKVNMLYMKKCSTRQSKPNAASELPCVALNQSQWDFFDLDLLWCIQNACHFQKNKCPLTWLKGGFATLLWVIWALRLYLRIIKYYPKIMT